MAYRNEQTILGAVGSILAQEIPEPIEVIVVTSGGDGTAKLVRESFPEVTLVESSVRLFPGAARNAGLAAASGDVVAFLAADCRAEPGWLARRLASHRAGHPAVASAITHAGPRRPWAWASYYVQYSGRLPGRPEGGVSPPDPAVHSLSFDRVLLETIGPFDGSVLIGEDTDAAHRLADLGIPIWFDPAIRTAHLSPRSLVSMLRDQFRRGGARHRLLIRTRGPSPSRSFAWIVASSAVVFVRRTRWTIDTCWRYGRGERWRVLLSLPFIVAARFAGAMGMCSEELRAARASHSSSGDVGDSLLPTTSS